ncbi:MULTISPECIES: SMI1/KNR4 family protein [unclassified Kitasatospora]|uniref:SMI1/KNR4 family protein n=1 Tax=unclassified Kitasatospora TaxID=2633591 RepID=UPI00381709E5
MDSIAHGVRESWERIGTWLNAHVRPASAWLASDVASLDAVEQELGLVLSEDLRTWWGLMGVSADFWLPGSFAPVGLEEAWETREIWLLVAEQEGLGLTEKGEAEAGFLTEFMPIAMSPDGDGLVVDLRSGEWQGAVFYWDHERWGLGVPLWESVGSMLVDIADALESGTPTLMWHADLGGPENPVVATVDDSRELGWKPAWI